MMKTTRKRAAARTTDHRFDFPQGDWGDETHTSSKQYSTSKWANVYAIGLPVRQGKLPDLWCKAAYYGRSYTGG